MSALYCYPLALNDPVKDVLDVVNVLQDKIFKSVVFPAPELPIKAVTYPPGQKPVKLSKMTF